MSNEKLTQWADRLLDLGKTNNLIKFRDNKSSSAELIYPDASVLFGKASNNANIEVYDPLADNADDLDMTDSDDMPDKMTFMEMYSGKIRKAHQVLIYNRYQSASIPLKNIAKRAKSALEETGVNVVWLAFGFVNWKERADAEPMNAPLLLIPVRLERQNQVSPWIIRTFGDELSVNTTFDYNMQQLFGVGMPPYQDEDLGEWLDKVSEVVSKLGWTVSNECKIGIFSFLKMNMYRDIKDNQDIILNNPIVKTILNEDTGSISQNADDFKRAANPLIDLHNVVDADSSQIEAIEMVKSGKSFVLQGPPGTGKSQTITNMIAECLFDGKKVLFVAEKQAALNVVYDKLRKAGLETFCLELHSHKANKKTVIEELCRTIRAEKTKVSSIAYDKIADKEQRQKALDDYESHLHKMRQPLGMSVFEMYEEYYGCGDVCDANIRINHIENKNRDCLRNESDLLARYASFTESVGEDFRENVWYGYNDDDNSFANVNRIAELLANVIKASSEFSALSGRMKTSLGLVADSYHKMQTVSVLLKMIKSGKVITPALLDGDIAKSVIPKLQKMQKTAGAIIARHEQIDEIFESTVYDLDGKNLSKTLTGKYNSFLSRVFGKEYKMIIAEIRGCTKSGKNVPYEKSVTYMKLLADCQKRESEFAKMSEENIRYLGKAFVGVGSDWEQILSEADKLCRMCDEGFDFGELYSICSAKPAETLRMIGDVSSSLDVILHNCADDYVELSQHFDDNIFNINDASHEALLSKLNRCHNETDTLSNWASFIKTMNELRDANLTEYIDYAVENDIPADKIVPTYRKTFYRYHIENVINNDEVLSSWTRAAHDRQVRSFCESDNEHFRINKAVIRESVSAKRPNGDTVVAGSPMQILFSEEKKKRRQKPIRELLSQTAGLVQVIKPCFMMSPLSVSTYLTANTVHFDVVIFDEASQIFPQDAIGAIYRGSQVVIVGDDRQMPPTNFFNVSFDSEDSDEDDDVGDFESVLDLCSVRMPQKRLRWHYRSRFESLISFSNKNFYDNDLVTFPSALADNEQDGAGVDYWFTGGVFDRRSRTNRIEAEAVVDKIFDNIVKFPNRSMGVVAFSVSQADLIDKLLSKRRAMMPQYESYFGEDCAEPFFVKNLETVQGDERDIIIFSTAYGADTDGRLLLNFGPVNRLGGERRLNVAVTRAKCNVQVVSSMHAEDIDLKRVTSKGAILFREYLNYAQNGHNVSQRQSVTEGDEWSELNFEEDVNNFLKDNGFCTDTHIGCSGFRIDIGVREPDSDDYVLAIECDGATYHGAANTRDRDRLRQTILERMGWTFYRIWSTAWFRNNRFEKQHLLEAVNAAMTKHEERIKNVKMTESVLSEMSDEQAVDMQSVQNDMISSEVQHSESVSENVVGPQNYLMPKNDDEDDAEDYETAVTVEVHDVPPYVMTDLSHYRDRDFTDRRKFFAVISDVLQNEAPLSEIWLHNRMSGIFTPARSKLTMKYINKMYGCETYGIVRRGGYLYLPENPIVMHGPMADGTVREIRYISPEEIAVGMMAALETNIQATKKGLFKTVASQLGFARMSAAITSKCEQALTLLTDRVECDGEIVRKR